MTIVKDQKDDVDQLLVLGVSDVIVREDLKKKLMSGKKLRIKLGIDPTGSDLHLGHMVVVHKLREFQELGHQIILLFGNFTGQIGDPTGKNETRPMRTQEELEKNAEHYLKQVSRLLDVSKIEVRWNAEWLAPLSFADVVKLSSNFTVSQMLERDMFQDRIKKDLPISMHEFFYPLMQGYDSVALKADVELGGTDQTFNMLAGRTLQKAYEQEPQNVMSVPILVGTDGTMKMGKTTGNYIGVNEKPEDMYGKTMSIPDDLILSYFELAGRVSKDEWSQIKKRLEGGENPRNLKMELAYKIVEIYHGAEGAKTAEAHFKSVVQNKEIPKDVETLFLDKSEWNVVELLSKLGLVKSTSDARRLIDGGAVKWNGVKIQDKEQVIELTLESAPSDTHDSFALDANVIQVGKRQFVRLFFKK
ncbi:MAG: tyrosine--tRNA ligase [Candidatus Gracilibacteria bacterium]